MLQAIYFIFDEKMWVADINEQESNVLSDSSCNKMLARTHNEISL